MFEKIKAFILGGPLPSAAEDQEKLNVFLGLAVYGADAISSTAFATEEILIALAASAYAVQGNLISLPVALAIVILIALVVISYRQVIKAYPQGGGAYIVAKENLGVLPSHIAAAALLTDYILTVSVNICAGVAAITSTGLLPHSQITNISMGLALLIMVVNLRGLKESGKAFAFPAYTFIFSMTLLIAVGVWKIMTGQVVEHTASPVAFVGHDNILGLGFLLIFLKAFSHGCAGLTGIEAVADGVKAFKAPAVKRANFTLALMGILLAGFFFGVTYLAFGFHLMPKPDETIMSQVGRNVFGSGSMLYLLVQFSTMIMLILAANTAFADFPRVCNFLAMDGYLPRQLKHIGDRLVFNNGIQVLGVISILLIWIFHGDIHALISLYAIGVFISFTSTQISMVARHLKLREPGWQWGIMINGLGGIVTAIVTIILGIEKFKEGAWIVIITIPLCILLFHVIKKHYVSIAQELALPEISEYIPLKRNHLALVLISSLNKGILLALEYAHSITDNVEAVYISVDEETKEELKATWEQWACKETAKLVIIDSPYRELNKPLLDYIEKVKAQSADDMITVILPEFVPKHWWQNFLHNQSTKSIRRHLKKQHNKIVTNVCYYLEG